MPVYLYKKFLGLAFGVSEEYDTPWGGVCKLVSLVGEYPPG
jgi:hypothetical protein